MKCFNFLLISMQRAKFGERRNDSSSAVASGTMSWLLLAYNLVYTFYACNNIYRPLLPLPVLKKQGLFFFLHSASFFPDIFMLVRFFPEISLISLTTSSFPDIPGLPSTLGLMATLVLRLRKFKSAGAIHIKLYFFFSERNGDVKNRACPPDFFWRVPLTCQYDRHMKLPTSIAFFLSVSIERNEVGTSIEKPT